MSVQALSLDIDVPPAIMVDSTRAHLANLRARTFSRPSCCRMFLRDAPAAIAGIGSCIVTYTALVYGASKAYDYKNPDFYDRCITVMKIGGYLGGLGVSLIIAVPIFKRAYKGCSNFCSGVRSTSSSIGKSLYNSVKPAN